MTHQTQRRGRGTRRVIVFVVPPIEELDVVGPRDVFTTANSFVAAPAYELQLVTAGKQRTIAGDTRLRLVADRHYKDVKGRIDTLLVSGGTGPRVTRTKTFSAGCEIAATRARRVVSVCTGAYLLAAAGMLDGKKATTH
jgi:transcriptional regulator GlxA family with amidase domain